jgi:hypothetical protein
MWSVQRVFDAAFYAKQRHGNHGELPNERNRYPERTHAKLVGRRKIY